MRLIESRFLEDCFDGTIMREVTLDEDISEPFVLYLGDFGELQYFPQFPRPFFIMEEPGKYILKGSTGKPTARIILSKSGQEENLAGFIKRCEYYKQERSGI